jgi:3-methyladenine DNA glycosylase AlkC
MADKGGDRAAAFSLKDHLFNADTLGQLAAEYAAGLPGFPAEAFLERVLPGLAERGLLERIDWIADCIEPHLAPDFPTMADQAEAAMPPPLDPSLTDDDFGQFIHAIPGVLAVRHGMSAAHLPRALDLLEAATQRFSMEFYIRPFLNAFPGPVMARLTGWTGHANYHVRRLVSEGTRPTLPWAKRINADPLSMLPLLDALHADPTRYVARSVANHLNDIAKTAPDRVLGLLSDWTSAGRQSRAEIAWMTKHALRTLVKQGHPGAMAALGYDPDAPVEVIAFAVDPVAPRIGETARVAVALTAPAPCPVLVDYVIWFRRPGGAENAKVHKLRTGTIGAGETLNLEKSHRFKAEASTYRLVPGPHRVALQVNGRIRAETVIDLRSS